MVYDDFEGRTGGTVGFEGEGIGDKFHDGFEMVGVVVVMFSLQDGSDSLESHSCIDGWFGEFDS